MYIWTYKRNGSRCGFLLTYWEPLNKQHKRMGVPLIARSFGSCGTLLSDERREASVKKAYKFRLYPNVTTEKKLYHVLNRCRELYNAGLSERKDAYQQ